MSHDGFSYPRYNRLQVLKWQCGNVTDLANSPHETNGQVIFDAVWDDEKGNTCELETLRIVNPEYNPHTEYHLSRRTPTGQKEYYLFDSYDKLVYVCDSDFTPLAQDRRVNQINLQRSLIDSLKSYPRSDNGSILDDYQMDWIMDNDTAFAQRMEGLSLDCPSRDTDTLISVITQKYPLVDEAVVRRGISRYLQSRELAD